MAAFTAGVLGIAFVFPLMAAAPGPDPRGQAGMSPAAAADIPSDALAAYQDAAGRWRMDWAILAAVGKLECDHGRSQLAGCNPPDTTNPVGARGYMQFLGSTWRRGLGQRELEPRSSPPAPHGQGYATDGDGDGATDPWSWPDAAHSAARYLVALGVNQDQERALYGYNRSRAYITDALAIASSYQSTDYAASGGAQAGTPGEPPLRTVEGITVHDQIAPQVEALVQAGRADGYTLTGSGYRAPERQIELRRQNCGTSQYAIYQMPSSECSPPTARPGTSNHERGLAVDFSCNGTLVRDRSSACSRWLASTAPAYGLYPLNSEPWHYSVDGN
jgi:hypothetical protein